MFGGVGRKFGTGGLRSRGSFGKSSIGGPRRRHGCGQEVSTGVK